MRYCDGCDIAYESGVKNSCPLCAKEEEIKDLENKIQELEENLAVKEGEKEV